jgi:outer membrane protein insertion porin family
MRWIWGILIALAFTAQAQEQDVPIINRIELKDLTRVSEPLIRSQLESKVGEAMSPPAIARDIRRISDMGYFTNVEVHLDFIAGQNVLVYKFFEERTIAELVIAGNKKIKERIIRSALNLQEGDAFFEEAFDTEREAVLDAYKEKGFLNATVDITAEEMGDTGMRVSYLINEGRKARIKKVKFEGNDALSDRKLRRLVKTGNGFLFFSGRYKEEKFEEDLRNIVEKYGDIGRLEAKVPKTDFDYSRQGKRVVITLDLSEGPEYTMANLDMDSNMVYTDGELMELIEVQPGEVHNKSQVEKDAEELKELYSDSGYVNARVTPLVTLDYENHTTNVIHQVNERQLKYIGGVTITGNAITKDEVIRRNIQLSPGDRFDGTLLDNSRNRLNQTRYFAIVSSNC